VVQIFVSVQSIEVLFSQSLLLSDYEVQVVLLGSNWSLNCSYFILDLSTLINFDV